MGAAKNPSATRNDKKGEEITQEGMGIAHWANFVLFRRGIHLDSQCIGNSVTKSSNSNP